MKWQWQRTISFDLSKLLSLNDILHQSTCRHTTQQNDIVERKIDTWLKPFVLGAHMPVHY